MAVAMIVAAPALASAESSVASRPDADQVESGRVAFTFGLLTPTGEIGAEVTKLVTPHLEVGVGLGYGVWGVQGSVMPRMRIGGATLGAGVSGGPWGMTSGGFIPGANSSMTYTTDTTVLWTNVELGYQTTLAANGFIRAYGGAGRLVAHSRCTEGACGSLDGTTLPYVGVAVGRAF